MELTPPARFFRAFASERTRCRIGPRAARCTSNAATCSRSRREAPTALSSTPDIEIKLDQFALANTVVREAVRLAILELGFLIEKHAKRNVQSENLIDTGALVNSIYVATELENPRGDAVSAAIAAGKTKGRKSGRAHDSTEIADEDPVVGEFVVKVAACVEYAVYLEFGTTHMDQKPFMTPAVAEVMPIATEFVMKRVMEALNNHA